MMGVDTLDGVKVPEFASVGQGPFCGMLLFDMGANLLRVDRKYGPSVDVNILLDSAKDLVSRDKRSSEIDHEITGCQQLCLPSGQQGKRYSRRLSTKFRGTSWFGPRNMPRKKPSVRFWLVDRLRPNRSAGNLTEAR